MAITFINNSEYDSASSASATVNKPTNTADGDVMFALTLTDQSISVVPSGWTLLANRSSADSIKQYNLYYKTASSEGSNYTWEPSSAGKIHIVITTIRGVFNSSLIEDYSNDNYTANDYTCRAGSVALRKSYEPVIFFGASYDNTQQTFTPPTDFTELYDSSAQNGSTYYATVAISELKTIGETGNIDSTMLQNDTAKHAFAVVLNIPTFYTLTSAFGSIILTGFDALFALVKFYILNPVVGLFTLTGQVTNLNKYWKMVSALGSYTLTGIATTLTHLRTLVCSAGSYIYTGFANIMGGWGSWKMTNVAKSITNWINKDRTL